MARDIVDKLRDHLTKPVDTECAVVYLLAEVRKLLDQEKSDPKPFALWIYCHWALHVELTHSKTTLQLLEQLDVYLCNTVCGLKPYGTPYYKSSDQLLRECVHLGAFRCQLRRFLNFFDLPTELCDDNKQWFRFMSAYAEVIREGELSSETSNNPGLQAVEKVIFTTEVSPSLASDLPFTMKWAVNLKDERTCSFELYATADLKMFVHDLHVSPSKEQ